MKSDILIEIGTYSKEEKIFSVTFKIDGFY